MAQGKAPVAGHAVTVEDEWDMAGPVSAIDHTDTLLRDYAVPAAHFNPLAEQIGMILV